VSPAFQTEVDDLLVLDHNHVYAGTSTNAVYETANGGAAWSPVLSADAPVSSLGAPLGLSGIILAGTSAGTIYKSTNGGATWATVRSTTGRVNQFAFDSSSSTVYAASNGSGVWKSVDNGTTWINVSAGISNLAVLGVEVDVSTPAIVIAGTNGSGFFRTTTGGQ
jgi:photosystem II stability/assembly factor-like uncharacterized protein